MKCMYCGYTESKVIDSRSTDEGRTIRRRRECLACQKRFTTYETVESLPIIVVKKDGKPWATDTVTTTGKPAALTLKPDRSEIKGDGYDLSYVTVAVRDAQGRMVPRSKNQLTFKVSGPADIAGICNGDPTDFTTMANPENKNIMKIKAFNGLAQVILRSRKGESGKVTLQVISNGLKPAQTTVTVK